MKLRSSRPVARRMSSQRVSGQVMPSTASAATNAIAARWSTRNARLRTQFQRRAPARIRAKPPTMNSTNRTCAMRTASASHAVGIFLQLVIPDGEGSNRDDAQSDCLCAAAHRLIQAKDALYLGRFRDGQVKGVARSQLARGITRKLGAPAELRAPRNGDRAVLLSEVEESRPRLLRQRRGNLAGPNLDRCGAREFSNRPFADDEPGTGGLDPCENGVALRFANERRHEGACVEVDHQ